MDSKLVVEQMSGRWKVKHPDMQVLAKQAAGLVRQLPAVTVHPHPPRARTRTPTGSPTRRWTTRPPAAHGSRAPEPGGPATGRAKADAPKPRRTRSTAGQRRAGSRTVAMLLRHGETPLSIEKRFSGRGDIALTDRGEAQAGGRRRPARRCRDRRGRVVAVAAYPADRRQRRAASSGSTSSSRTASPRPTSASGRA